MKTRFQLPPVVALSDLHRFAIGNSALRDDAAAKGEMLSFFSRALLYEGSR